MFKQNLEQGKAIVLLDGLDEVLEARTRQLISRGVQAFIDRYLPSGNRIVLTAGHIGVVDANEREVTAFVQQILTTNSLFNRYSCRDELLAAACLADEIDVGSELAKSEKD